MKRLIFILLLVIYCGTYTSKAEAAPSLEAGTSWRQVAYGTLGMTLSLIPYVYMLEKRLPIRRRFKSENPTFWGSCILTGVSITTVVGPFAIMELCTRGIELGYMHQNDKRYRGNLSSTRLAIGLGIPITVLGGAISLAVWSMTQELNNSKVENLHMLSIPLAFLTIPSILGARSYNKSLKKRPIEAEINILRVAF